MNTNVKLTDPYEDIVPDTKNPNWLRLSLDVSRQEAFFLYSILMERGTLSIVLSNYLKHLVTHAKLNNWTVGDRDKLIAFVNERCATGGPADAGRSNDDGRRTPGVREDGQRPPNKPTTKRRKQASSQGVEDPERTDGVSTNQE